MIIKKLKRTSFKKSKAVMIGGLVDYILAEHDDSGKDKLAYAGSRNFLTTTVAAQKKEMISLAEESIQSKMPVTHWILSWQENEQPSREQVDEACVLANYVAGIVVGRWGRHAIRVARHGAMGLDKDRFRPVSKPVLLWSSWPNFCTTL